MARSRWFVVVGPPLIVFMAGLAAAGLAGRPAGVNAGTLPTARSVTACNAYPGGASTPQPGAWWRSVPHLDVAGTLQGWRLSVGAVKGASFSLDLPAASTVSGPDRGRVLAATDDGSSSSVRVIDVASGCSRDLDVGDAIARRAMADPSGDGILVHLVARGTRADLGVWHLAPDGSRTLVLGAASAAMLGAAGIDRVWATNLVASRDGGRLAVQSCDPDSCLTRILERASGRIIVLLGEQGDAVGFSGDRLVTLAACDGSPCGVLAWNDRGTAAVLADSSVGAAVAADGAVVVAVPGAGSAARAIVIDPGTRARRDVGSLAGDAVPFAASGSSSGIETGPDAVGLAGSSGPPTILELGPAAATPAQAPEAAPLPAATTPSAAEMQP